MHVDRERAERRDVDDARPGVRMVGIAGGVVARVRLVGAVGGVDRDEEPGQCLTGAGGRGDQHVTALTDARPCELLRLGRPVREPGREPAGHRRVEVGEDRIGQTGGISRRHECAPAYGRAVTP